MLQGCLQRQGHPAAAFCHWTLILLVLITPSQCLWLFGYLGQKNQPGACHLSKWSRLVPVAVRLSDPAVITTPVQLDLTGKLEAKPAKRGQGLGQAAHAVVLWQL